MRKEDSHHFGGDDGGDGGGGEEGDLNWICSGKRVNGSGREGNGAPIIDRPGMLWDSS